MENYIYIIFIIILILLICYKKVNVLLLSILLILVYLFLQIGNKFSGGVDKDIEFYFHYGKIPKNDLKLFTTDKFEIEENTLSILVNNKEIVVDRDIYPNVKLKVPDITKLKSDIFVKILREININISDNDYQNLLENKSIIINNKIYNIYQLQTIVQNILEKSKKIYKKILTNKKFPNIQIIPNNSDEWVTIIKKDNKIIGYVIGDEYDDEITINILSIHPKYTGQHLCVPLLQYTLKKLLELGYTKFNIYNDSRVHQGIPACYCYYRAANNLNLEVIVYMYLREESCKKRDIPRMITFIKK